jgi:hypothetical protein
MTVITLSGHGHGGITRSIKEANRRTKKVDYRGAKIKTN